MTNCECVKVTCLLGVMCTVSVRLHYNCQVQPYQAVNVICSNDIAGIMHSIYSITLSNEKVIIFQNQISH
jgi:hypothetical protein